MSHAMDTDGLRKLKKGHTVCVDGKTYTITSAGYKWIRLEGLKQPINVNTARLQTTGFGSGHTAPIYRTDTLYDMAQDFDRQVRITERSLRAATWAVNKLPSNVILDIQEVLNKHGLLVD